MQDVHFIKQADEAAELLKPVRIEILKRLSTPRTCPELARELGMTTQKVNYHMNVLKGAGLALLVEERRNRGTVEGVYQAIAKSYWFSPHLVRSLGNQERSRDQASLAYLLQLAEDLQIDIGRIIDDAETKSIPSLGVNAQIQLRNGTERASFLAEIQGFFSHLAEKYGSADDGVADDSDAIEGERYKLMLACYSQSIGNSNINTNGDNNNG